MSSRGSCSEGTVLRAGAALVTPLVIEQSVTLFFYCIAGVLLAAGLIGWFWVSRMPEVIHQEKVKGPQSARVLAEQAK